MRQEQDRRPYALYHGDRFIKEGTVEELAEHEGVKPETIRYYMSPSYAKRSGNKAVVPLHDEWLVNTTDLDKIKQLIKASGLSIQAVGEQACNMDNEKMYRKVSGKNRFKEYELIELAEFFGLELDDLLKR